MLPRTPKYGDLGSGILAWAHAPLPLLLAVARASWASLGQCDAAECSAAIAVRICGERGGVRGGARGGARGATRAAR